MKMTRLIYPVILAAAVGVLSTGCRHKPVGLTQLNGPAAQVGNPSDLNPVTPITTPGTGIGSDNNPNAPGAGPQANQEEFEGMIADRQALAANSVHFKFDSAAILPGEQGNLDSVAQALKNDPSTKLKIEGNCDERGTEEYNRALGERRALAARKALAGRGIDPQRIMTESFGKDKPVDPGHDDSAWAKNRRDDFVLLHPKPGQ